MPTEENPVEAVAGDREGTLEALFCLVHKLGGWGEKSCRLKSNHISDVFQLCSISFSFRELDLCTVKCTNIKWVFQWTFTNVYPQVNA